MDLKLLTKPIFWLPWVAIATMSYFFVDQPLTIYAHHLDLRQPWLVTTFLPVTQLGNAAIYLSAGGLAFLWATLIAKNAHQGWRAGYFLLSIIVSGVLCDFLKVILGRARPAAWFLNHQYGFYFWQFHNAFWSCPSGHATTAAAVATAGYLLTRRFAWFFILIALSVGVSRIILQHHYLSDVMAGWALGFLMAYWLKQKLLSHG